jgi:hypothetical protein
MAKQTSTLHFLILFFSVLVFSTSTSYSQTQNESNSQSSQITIFVIPSLSPIDWSNPSILFKTAEKCFFQAIIRKNYYIIGHTIARITSPLLAAPYYVAMSGKIPTEKPELLLIKKIGFGAMGATIKGHIETEKSIKKGIELYSKRNEVAFIKFNINEQSVRRILELAKQYQTKSINGYAPCDLYNGATWPRYKDEGSGCSGFGMSLLDAGGVLPPEAKDWYVDVKIPMDLIGGEFNGNKKIKIRSILKTKSWYEGTGVENIDYVNYKTYDPGMIFNWIINMRSQNNPNYRADEENGIKGVIADRQNIVFAPDEPLYLQRTDSDVFIKHYYQKLRNLRSTTNNNTGNKSLTAIRIK